MKVEKKYPKFNSIMITIESQEEIDTLRTALCNLHNIYPAENMVRVGDIETRPEVMQSHASNMLANLDGEI